MHIILLGRITALARCGLLLQIQTVDHNREPCKNGWTNLDAIWDVDCGWGPRNRVLDGGPEGAIFDGKSAPAQGAPGRPAVDMLKATQQGAKPVRCRCWLGVLDGMPIGTTWRMRLCRPCVAVVRPYVKLLLALVLILTLPQVDEVMFDLCLSVC